MVGTSQEIGADSQNISNRNNTNNLDSLAVVILAAGKGTRMKSRLPKVLHEVGGEPMLFHVLREVESLGVPPQRTVIVVGNGAEQVRAAVSKRGDYLFAEQIEQLGTAHAVQQAETVLTELENSQPGSAKQVLVLYGDCPLVTAESLQPLVERHFETNPLVTLVTATLPDPTGYGRIFRDPLDSAFRAIVEEADLTPAQREIKEFNAGIYVYRADWLWKSLREVKVSPKGEYYLTDLPEAAAATRFNHVENNENGENSYLPVQTVAIEADEVRGINNRVQLAEVDALFRRRIITRFQLDGVTINDPSNVYISAETEIGQDTVIEPNTHLRGKCRIGSDCRIGPNSVLENAVIGDNCEIVASFIENSTLEEAVTVGPFSHVRGGCYLEREVHLGNFAEVNRSRLGTNTKQGHFSYIGDATIGEDVNIGAGTVTANYDGVRKNKTVVGPHAFIGSDTIIRAPVEIGEGASTGAGSVVTHDVPAHTVVAGVPARELKKS